MNSRGNPPPTGGSAILASSMVTIQAVVAMVTVPVAMVTGLVAMEIYGILQHVTKLRSRDT